MASAALPYPHVEPTEVRATALRLGQLAERAGEATDTLRMRAEALSLSWAGPAAVACGAELHAAGHLARRVGAPLRSASALLLAFAESAARTRARVDQLRAEYAELVVRHRAEQDRLVAQTAVAPAARVVLLELLLAEQRHELAGCSRRHAQALEEFRVVARTAGRRLAALAADALPPGSATGGRPADSEASLAAALPMLFAQRALFSQSLGWPPPPETPAPAVRAAWALLAEDEQNRLISAHAPALGALGGLPSSARSRANELVLGQVIGTLSARQRLTTVEDRALSNALTVRWRLRKLRKLEDPVTGEPVVAQLIVFDPQAYEGDGRAAVAIGDIDSADNVAFLVPGLGSNINKSWGGLTTNAHRVMDLARRRDPHRTTAVVAWMGYDAPDLLRVLNDDAAERGGTLLVRDLRELAAVREVAPHTTLIGHSYGSTTVGHALQGESPGVDDAVILGSPGVGVERASELNVPAGHVYTAANSRDRISYLDYFAEDPTHESFGGVRFEAEDPTRTRFRSQQDHSKYFEASSESLSNTTDVVISRYDDVTPAPYRSERPFVLDHMSDDPEASRAPTRVREHGQ